MQRLKIAYITLADPHDKHSWSGTNYYILQALQKQVGDVIPLGPAEPVLATFICKVIHGLSLLFFRKRFDYRHSTFYSKACARIFRRKLEKIECDVIITPAYVNAVAYLQTKKPIVLICDRVIGGAIGYHEILTGLWKWSLRQSIQTDKLAMQKAAAVIFSSQWAADFALNDYKIPESKVHVIPFGANMDTILSSEAALKPKEKSPVKMLLVGTSWKNKGADIAVKAIHHLREMGISAQLTVVGCAPPAGFSDPDVTVIPFVNKNSQEGARQLNKLFSMHHFFILPTRFDCTPIVFCEASSYGLPVISARTGGVAGHVKEGENGFLIDYADKGKGYAEKISELIQDPERYEALRVSTRKMYDNFLNWDRWGEVMKVFTSQLLARN